MGNLLLPTGGTFGTGPALGVWQRIPKQLIEAMPGKGHGFFDDFVGMMGNTTTTTYSSDGVMGWYYAEYTDGALANAGLEGGVISLLGAANTQGCQIRTSPSFVMDTDCQLAWGVRYKMVDADAQNTVMGLAVATDDYPGEIAGTTADAIVLRHTADATIFYQVNTGAGGMTAATTGATDVSDDTWVTVDCFIDKESAVEFWVDGVLKVTYKTTANFPTDTAMAFVLANESTESANDYLYVDWAYAYQWRKDI